MKRTHRCGEVDRDAVGTQVLLQGWVWRRRDLGGLIFVDLRDRAGSVQCVFDPDVPVAHETAQGLRQEFVVEVAGVVEARAPENVNANQPNGDIEVRVSTVEILARSETPPFSIDVDASASEELRLKHRYLDLRRPPLQKALRLRHDLALAARNLLAERGFLEIETPMLTRSTPEGARDYLVPSRVHPGHFYALPQSPQLFKQLLMVSGYDRYFQIVRCFRDEDLRADRQPEFTQIDIEMSFIEPDDVMELTEALLRRMLELSGHDSNVEFPRLTFREALDRYGSDRPDLRYDHELVDLGDLFAESGFRAFAGVVAAGGAIKGLRVPGGGAWGRGRLDRLTDDAKRMGAKGLVWIKLSDGEFVSPVAKFLGAPLLEAVAEAAGMEDGDALLIVGDEWELAATVVGGLRTALAAEEGWIGDGMRFCWVTEFPLLEQADGRLAARHHPFTSPHPEDLERLESAPLEVRAQAYDVVLNGLELGGGSVRIHRSDVQERVFAALGIDAGAAEEKFGFLLRALRHGAPPHGGIALGFDRIVMLMAGLRSLREVIAFPKTTSATDLMTDAPGRAADGQLGELHIDLRDVEAAPADAGETNHE